MGDDDDPFSSDDKEPRALKTFYIKVTTLNKIRELQALAHDPRKILASINGAIDSEVYRLEKVAPKNK